MLLTEPDLYLFIYLNENGTTNSERLVPVLYLCNLGMLALDNGANVAKSCDQEGNCLEEEVYEVIVLPMDKIIASAEEEEHSKSQLQSMHSVNENACEWIKLDAGRLKNHVSH